MVKSYFELYQERTLQKKERKPRQPQVFVSNALRIELLILITEFGLSCYLAARTLNIPYTNAKVIYRVFREENRVTSNARFMVKHLCYGST